MELTVHNLCYIYTKFYILKIKSGCFVTMGFRGKEKKQAGYFSNLSLV